MPGQNVSVATLLPWLTEMVADLGLSSTLVARSHECVLSEYINCLPAVTAAKLYVPPGNSGDSISTSAEIAAGWRAVKAMDSAYLAIDSMVSARLCSYFATDITALANVRPNVVLTHVAPCRNLLEPSEDEIVAALKEIVPSVEKVISLDMSTLREVYAGAAVVARALQCPSSSGPAVKQAQLRLKHVRQVTRTYFESRTKRRPRLAVIQWTDPLYLAGGWIPEIIAAAGCASVFCTPGGPSLHVEPSALSQVDVVIVAICAVTVEGAEKIMRDFWRSQAQPLASCKAQVVLADATRLFSRSSLSTVVDTAECIASIATNSAVFSKSQKWWKSWVYSRQAEKLVVDIPFR